jgi:hypothetical protein
LCPFAALAAPVSGRQLARQRRCPEHGSAEGCRARNASDGQCPTQFAAEPLQLTSLSLATVHG